MSEETIDLKGYVNDMLAVETEFHASLRRQKDDEKIRGCADAHKLIAIAEDVVDHHISSLQKCLKRLDADESVVKQAVGSVLGAAAGIYNQLRSSETASRALRDDYAALCFGSVCYEMLHTTALAMNDSATAKMAIENLADFPPIIIAISRAMPTVLVEELTEERKVRPDPSIALVAVRNTRAAWSDVSATN